MAQGARLLGGAAVISTIALSLALLSGRLTGAADAAGADLLPPADRLVTAARVYHAIEASFAQWDRGGREEFDRSYRRYVERILEGGDRRDFDVATATLVAGLQNGHTWFGDDWRQRREGRRHPFSVRVLGDRWIVSESQIPSLSPGDLLASIDGTPIEEFFASRRGEISASSDRDARTLLFSQAALFPRIYRLGVANGASVTVDRSASAPAAPERKTEGRWLVSGEVAYIRVPSFDGAAFEAAALDRLREFHDARSLVLDIRGNPGGSSGAESGRELRKLLMDRPFRSWLETSPVKIGTLSSRRMREPELNSGETREAPAEVPYRGRLFILIDRECASACESFAMPFKDNGRAVLLGETTAGTYSETEFLELGNGMKLNVAATRVAFPDGSRFEGVGIPPDVAVTVTPEDLRAGRDPVVAEALRLAREKSAPPGGPSKSDGPCSENPAAQELSRAGLESLGKSDTRAGGNLDNARKAIALFEQAARLNPRCADSFIHLAEAWSRFSFSVPGSLSNAETYPHELAAALAAVRLDDGLVRAHALLADIDFNEAFDWSSAEKEYRRVIELDPGSAAPHVRYGIFLGAMGRFEAASEEIRRARAIDDSGAFSHQAMLQILYWQHRDEEALEQGREALRKDSKNLATHYLTAFVLEHMGRFSEAIEHAMQVQVWGDAGGLSMLGYAYAASGNKAEAERVLEKLSHHGGAKNVPYRIAAIHLALGNRRKALDLIERDYDQRSNWINRLKVDPIMDPLRDEPRFRALMRKLKFPE